jgi:hypothetical protein
VPDSGHSSSLQRNIGGTADVEEAEAYLRERLAEQLHKSAAFWLAAYGNGSCVVSQTADSRTSHRATVAAQLVSRDADIVMTGVLLDTFTGKHLSPPRFFSVGPEHIPAARKIGIVELAMFVSALASGADVRQIGLVAFQTLEARSRGDLTS